MKRVVFERYGAEIREIPRGWRRRYSAKTHFDCQSWRTRRVELRA